MRESERFPQGGRAGLSPAGLIAEMAPSREEFRIVELAPKGRRRFDKQ